MAEIVKLRITCVIYRARLLEYARVVFNNLVNFPEFFRIRVLRVYGQIALVRDYAVALKIVSVSVSDLRGVYKE